MIHITPDLEKELQEKGPEEQVHVIVRAVRVERPFVLKALEKPTHTIRQHVRLINAFSMALPAQEIEKLAEEPWVEWIEPDKEVKATLDTSVPLMVVPEVWKLGFTGKRVNVAIIDTGVDKNHPDLTGRIIATKDFTLEGFFDLNGHGTMVAGVIAGNGSASEEKYRGIAPRASLMVAKALKLDGTGRMSDVMAAIDWAVNIGAHVINLSLGSSGSSDGKDALSETCDAAVNQGVVVCVAAGNDGPERRTIGSPAAARNVITIGASTDNDLVAEFSSCGPTVDNRPKPDVVVPGVEIVSALAKGAQIGEIVNEHYAVCQGTSLAAPHISGLCALFLEAKPEASPALIKEALIHTAKDLGFDHSSQGAGKAVALDALNYVLTHENPPEISEVEYPPPGCLGILFEAEQRLIKKFLKKPKT